MEPPAARRKELQVLDEKQTAHLLAAARGTWLYAPLLVAVTTGLRRGELLGLRWSDVDLHAGRIHVRQALQETREGMIYKEPKTSSSRRAVLLPGVAIEALTRHREEQALQRLAVGRVWQNTGLVFTLPDGAPVRPEHLTKSFIKLARRLGFGNVRLHDLRHSHATHLLGQGVHAKIVSERLGHSGVGITLDTYSHVLPSMQEDAARRLDTAFRAVLGDEEERDR